MSQSIRVRLLVLLAVVAGCVAAAPEPAAEPTALAVRDRAGLPVQAARVLALPVAPAAGVGEPGLAPASAEPRVLGVTTDTGELAWPGQGRLRVEADGFLPFEGDAAATIVLTRPSLINVRVIDAVTRLPLAGLELSLRPARPRGQAEDGGEPPPPLATVKTRSDGRVVFPGLVAAAYRVRLESPRYLRQVLAAAPPPEGQDNLLLELERALPVTGLVVAGDKPVVGARITADMAFPGWGGARRERPDRRSTEDVVTDARGEFSLRDVPARLPGSLAVVAVAADGRFGVQVIDGSPLAAVAAGTTEPVPVRLSFDLARQASASGHVIDEDGLPVAGTKVVARLPVTVDLGIVKRTVVLDLGPAFESATKGPAAALRPDEVMTDADGKFRFARLPARAWQVLAQPDGHAGSEAVDISLADGPAEAIELVLVRGERLTGQVVDVNGNPIPDATVRIGERGDGPFGRPGGGGRGRRGGLGDDATTVTTGSDGRFSAEGLPTGALRLVVTAEAFARAEQDAASGADVRVVLAQAGRLSGRVLAVLTGEPVPRFAVTLVEDRGAEEGGGPRRRQAPRREFTAVDGAFTFDEVAPGRWATVIESDGYLPHATPVVEVLAGADVTVGDVALSEGAVLVGVVSDAGNGAPVAGASVRIEGLGAADGGRGRFRMPGGPRGGERESAGTVSDEEGRFRLTSVPAGDFTVTVSHAEFPSAEARVSVPDDPGGREIPVLVKLSSGGSLLVRVIDASGAPLAGIHVAVSDAASGGRRPAAVAPPLATGEDGTVTFDGLLPGLVNVLRLDRVENVVQATVVRGEVAQAVLQDAGATVHGRVLLGDQPLRAVVALRGGRWRPGFGNPSDTYSIDGVEAGEVVLDVTFSERRPDGRDVERRERERLVVEPGVRDVLHDIVLEPTPFDDEVVVAGSVTDAATGAGLDGWTVFALRLGEGGRIDRTGAEIVAQTARGAFELRLPDDSAFTVRAMGPRDEERSWIVPEPLRVAVENGHLVTPAPEFVVQARLEVQVTVADVGGEPVAAALCALVTPAANLGQRGLSIGRNAARTDGLGQALARADEAGRYDLVVALQARALIFVPRLDVQGWSEQRVQVPRVGSVHVAGVRSIEVVEQQTGNQWWVRVEQGSDVFGLGSVTESGVTLHGLPGGSYVVRAGERSRRVDVAPGVVTEVDLGG